MNLSSGESSGEGEGDDDKDEERDSEATFEGTGETSPWRRSSALYSMPDDDEAGAWRGGEGPALDPEEGQVWADLPRVYPSPRVGRSQL